MSRTSHSGPTVESVAAVAGVSRQTVSNVINTPERVSPPTRARVLAAIDELNYRPNRMARSLRTRASRLLGYCVQPTAIDALNPMVHRFIHAITEASASRGFHVLLFTAPAGADGLDQYVELLAQQAVDGFVLSDTQVGDPRPAWLAERGVPFVAFGRTYGEEHGPWVDVDGAAGIARAVEHVYALGHRTIAFVGWPEASGVGDDRLAGYHAACRRLGVSPRVVRGAGMADAGRALAGRLLDDPEPPTALVCVSDFFAHGALSALLVRGLRPGRDVAVTGFDDLPWAAMPGFDLTSLSQPIEEIGQAVVEMLVTRLTGHDEPSGPPSHQLLEPTLTVRSSSQP